MVVCISWLHLCLCVCVCDVACVGHDLNRCTSVCDLFVETIHNIFGCGCYFVVECYGSV